MLSVLLGVNLTLGPAGQDRTAWFVKCKGGKGNQSAQSSCKCYRKTGYREQSGPVMFILCGKIIKYKTAQWEHVPADVIYLPYDKILFCTCM